MLLREDELRRLPRALEDVVRRWSTILVSTQRISKSHKSEVGEARTFSQQ